MKIRKPSDLELEMLRRVELPPDDIDHITTNRAAQVLGVSRLSAASRFLSIILQRNSSTQSNP